MYCGHKIILTSAWLSYRLTVLTCSWGVMPAREKCFNKYWLVSATATTDRPYIQQIIVSFLLFDQRWTFWSVPCFAKNSQMWSVLQWQPSPCQLSLHSFYKSWLQQWWQGVDGSNGGKKVDADGDLRGEGCGSSAKQDTAKRVKLVPIVMKMFVSMRIWRRRRSKRRLFVSKLSRGVEIKLHGARRRKAGSGFGKL